MANGVETGVGAVTPGHQLSHRAISGLGERETQVVQEILFRGGFFRGGGGIAEREDAVEERGRFGEATR